VKKVKRREESPQLLKGRAKRWKGRLVREPLGRKKEGRSSCGEFKKKGKGKGGSDTLVAGEVGKKWAFSSERLESEERDGTVPRGGQERC